MARLRATRDRLLSENFGEGGIANNPLQQLAAPAVQAVGEVVGAVCGMNILANIGKGAAVGSILIPDDAAVDPAGQCRQPHLPHPRQHNSYGPRKVHHYDTDLLR